MFDCESIIESVGKEGVTYPHSPTTRALSFNGFSFTTHVDNELDDNELDDNK